MKFTDLNPKREIGAHSLLIELGEFRLLVDGGMSPKDVGLSSLPDYTRIPSDSIDLILLTHCHLDHIGSLPCVHRSQPSARVLMTPASGEILPVMLQNSYTVMLRQRDEKNVEEYPLFSRPEVDAVLGDFFPMHFGRMREFVKNGDRLKITFFPAGHVMGAAAVLLEHRNKKYFFTGDILFRRQHTLNGAQIPSMKVDVLITETTRGLAEHSENFLYEDELARLLESVAKAIKGGGSCLLPVFALGRMQEVIALIYEGRKRGILPSGFPIYCSGLGLAVVDVFEKIMRDRKKYGIDYAAQDPIAPPVRQDLRHKMAPSADKWGFRKRILSALNVRPLPRNRIKAGVDIRRPSLFIVSSGMLVENTPAYQVAASLLPFSHNLIAFTGYCDPDTPGGHLLALSPGDSFTFAALEFVTAIGAHVEHYDASGHADREDLLYMARAMEPSSVVLSHGDDDARHWFENTLKLALPQARVVNPEPQRTYEF
ncbi:MAG: MBL fold metallo-hydrolase [Puniceicoccales bacterium]|jgi:Cft2 family RNA processing exonuclease|nr:MBL fold metallo-hydrolase [Puniceicoccales bacterium]